jgi:hypothetical protein
MATTFKIGDSVMTRFDNWTVRLQIVKSKNIKKAKTVKKAGTTIKMYPAKSKGRGTFEELCNAANYLHRNTPYRIEGFTANGGIILEGFMLPVSKKDLILIAK